MIEKVKDIKDQSNSGNKNFIIFPNPAAGKLNVQSLVTLKDATLSVLSMEGKELKSISMNVINPGEIIPVNLKEIPSGIYMLKITDSNQHNVVMKFMIQ